MMDDNIYFLDDDEEDVCGGDGGGEVEDPVASLLGLSNAEAAAPPLPVLPEQTTMNTPQSKSNSSTVMQQQQEAMSQSPMMHQATMTPPPTTTPSGDASNVKTVDELNEDLANLLLHNHALPQSSVMAIQSILRENNSLKEKNNKLKSLLGRSAKAQRDVKNELEAVRKAYEAALNNCTALEKRLEVLANRPTHMDLLADFETNFDRALLSASSMGIGGGGILSRNYNSNNQQSGGEDAAETTTSMTSMYDNMINSSSSSSSSEKRSSSRAASDPLLTIELAESQDLITHLHSIIATLQERVTSLEHENRTLLLDNTTTRNTVTNLQLELRMSKMETEHHVRTIKDKDANITEMQLEIDLVTQSAVDANRRAAEGYVVAQAARSDKEYVEGLEMKVVALQEWALASTESKQLTLDRCRGLEGRVKELEGMMYHLSSTASEQQRGGGGDGTLLSSEDNLPSQTPLVDYTPLRPTLHHPSSSSSSSVGGNSSMGGNDNEERSLWTKSSSLVIGAGMIGHVILELGQVHIESYETVVLRWKFDITPIDLDIYFSILKGSVNCLEDKKLMRSADACFRHRHVTGGGGGGDVSGAFAKQNSCTLLWSNEMSWVRPRTIKWIVEAVAIEWND